ncbi:uncharacterized protein TNCV_3994391 [Trichonephila clavipes]|uniref:Uncharacterized protein n=1 Tax=Trichonephila clavipes TaxID=2585209 RepID=A0A8X6VT76_TRICX|nr:uncharacterized protein TNCV_3994391 [Trichonephila clavipes]
MLYSYVVCKRSLENQFGSDNATLEYVTNLYGTFPLIFLGVFLENINSCLSRALSGSLVEKRTRNWSVFVANRVKEIRELTQFQSWRHVPSNMNIADLLSRGCTPQNMLDSKWWEGPRWLKKNREQWPANEIKCEHKDAILEKKEN